MHYCAAECIAEDLLYITGKSLIDGDFDMFAECFALPGMMETAQGQRIIRTRDDLHQTFCNVLEVYRRDGVVDMARTVISAEFLDADTVGSTHVTSLLRADRMPHRSPFPVYSVIRRFDLSWRIVSSIYAILDSPEHNRALMARRTPHVAD